MKVAVIGAGLSGLCCLRHLTKSFKQFECVAYEQTCQVGGTWYYTDSTGFDSQTGLPIHSSMYKNMRTNLPKQVMCFPDFPFSTSAPTFIHHSIVYQYLQEYALHYQLYDYIQFNTQVTKVRPIASKRPSALDGVSWEVETKDVLSGNINKETYDIILVCNGHYFRPYMDIPGLNNFQGTVLHSHYYRIPEPFKGKTVLIVGGGQSGTDISLEVSSIASKVIICHDKKFLSPLPENIYEVGRLVSINGEGSIVLDGEELIKDIDAIILCTGYNYEFPFLTPECGIQICNRRVTSLYKHFISTLHPSMAFIGLNFTIVPSIVVDSQVQYYLSVLSGRAKLPSQDEMRHDEEKDYQERMSKGYKRRHAHILGDMQWDYCNELATMGGFEPIKPVVKSLYDEVGKERTYNVAHYKDLTYKVVSDELFVVVN